MRPVAVALTWVLGFVLLRHVPPAASIDCGKDSVNEENRLKKSLLCNGYRTEARPRKDPAQTVNLTVSYYVYGYEFDDDNDLLTVNVWFSLQWVDEFLVWNATRWNKIERLAINSDEMWLPDFRHFSSFYNPEELPDCTNPSCSVAQNGSVYCIPMCSMNARCDADYSRWPFDVHQCNLWYGTWVNSMNEVDMHLKDICLSSENDFTSKRWAIASLSKGRSVLKSSDSYHYTILNVDLTLRRRNGFEVVAILAPILVLALLNLYIVWQRSCAFERKLLLVVSIACHFSFLQQLDWAIPFNRDTVAGCLVFLHSSTIIAAVLGLVTLLNCWIRARPVRDSATPGDSCFGRVTGAFSQNRVAELILAADYLELNYKITSDDESAGYWLKVATLVDRVVAIVCVIVYVVLLCLYMPFGHQLTSSSGVKCVFSFS
ncbi:neuronal acetylcholine receptor subunit beta-3-like [Anopheles cruzii]|uniref:neuronal acetylcholine receptor subunit beta-3-like n=1 Tax=Anopheles cruzii TaxID=68878 RepID=UPI0022EC96A4|nr:neuronal acetylcholine receptor subunit beta-3-like [Anopheles cruzii]